MANPNSIVYNFRHAKYACIETKVFNKHDEAFEAKESMRKDGKFDMVKMTRFRTGSRVQYHKQTFSYAVRGYKKEGR